MPGSSEKSRHAVMNVQRGTPLARSGRPGFINHAGLATRRCRETLPKNLYQCLSFGTAAATHPSAISKHWRGHGDACTLTEPGANQLS